jgi:hypothetical protein
MAPKIANSKNGDILCRIPARIDPTKECMFGCSGKRIAK